MASRKTAQIRERELRLAIRRIEKGRAHTKANRINISSVALEAGVSAALIHNHYPQIAEIIRTKQGASSRQKRDAKHEQLNIQENRNKKLNSELKDALNRVRLLASINETLIQELSILRARVASPNVSNIQVQFKNR